MITGPIRLSEELTQLGYLNTVVNGGGQSFVVIESFNISVGRFAGSQVSLGIPAPPDFPRTVGPSLHVRSTPLLLTDKDNVQGKINVLKSPLGDDWRYWSFGFKVYPDKVTERLMTQIYGVFRDI